MTIKVAIIGGGPSGLAAAKCCVEAQLEPTVFERDCHLGGLWKRGRVVADTTAEASQIFVIDSMTAAAIAELKRGCRVWKSLRTNLSKHTCCFSNFRWPEDAPVFPSSAQVREYIEDYATAFDLRKFVRFGHVVTSVSKSSTGAWDVEFTARSTPQQGKANDRHTETFDKCIVASGIFTEPYFPPPSKVQGIPDAVQSGWATHGAAYRDPSFFAGKTVLVVGCAFSGAEIASDLAGTTLRCLAASGRPSLFVPRLIFKREERGARACRGDGSTPTAGQEGNSSCVEVRDGGIGESSTRLVPLDMALYSRKGRTEYKASTTSPEDKIRAAQTFLLQLTNKDPGEVHNDLKLDGDSDCPRPPHVAVSDDFLTKVQDGLIEVRPRLVAVDAYERKARFADGTTEEVDHVIFCTGLRPCLGFLSQSVLHQLEHEPDDLLQPLILEHQTWRACVPDLAFVGIYRGPYFGVMELQARWATRMWGGLVNPPPPTASDAALRESRGVRAKHPRPQFPTDYVDMMEVLAMVAGLIPLSSPLLHRQYRSLATGLPYTLQAAPPTSEVRHDTTGSLGADSSKDPRSSIDIDDVLRSPKQRTACVDLLPRGRKTRVVEGSDAILMRGMDHLVEWMWSGPLLPCHYFILPHLTKDSPTSDGDVIDKFQDHGGGRDGIRVGLKGALSELRSVNIKYGII